MSERNLKQVDILNKSLPLQKELNIKMGKSTLSQYVTGKQAPDDQRYYLLSKLFEVSIPWLMGFDVPKERVPDDQCGQSSTIDKTTAIMKKLDGSRKEKVCRYAEDQWEEQLAEQTKPAQQSAQITDIKSYKDGKKCAADSYGAVSAGTGEFLFGVERAETVYLPESSFPDEPFDYVLKINGDSMLPTYKDGEYIFVKSFSNGGNIRNGMLAIVLYDNEVYFKKLYFDDSGIRLVSLNKEYKDIVITDPSCFQVLGKVVA